MQFRTPLACALAASLVITGLVYTGFAADAPPTTMPTTAPTISRPMTKSGKPRAIRLVKPWSDVKDLSEDQKIQIFTIHDDTADKITALKEEEQAKCMALLTDAQKASLNESMATDKVADKKAAAK